MKSLAFQMGTAKKKTVIFLSSSILYWHASVYVCRWNLEELKYSDEIFEDCFISGLNAIKIFILVEEKDVKNKNLVILRISFCLCYEYYLQSFVFFVVLFYNLNSVFELFEI